MSASARPTVAAAVIEERGNVRASGGAAPLGGGGMPPFGIALSTNSCSVGRCVSPSLVPPFPLPPPLATDAVAEAVAASAQPPTVLGSGLRRHLCRMVGSLTALDIQHCL